MSESRRDREAPAPVARTTVAKKSASGRRYIDYKATETLRRHLGGNGKLFSQGRNGISALEQRMLASAVKRARYMALLPYVAQVQ